MGWSTLLTPGSANGFDISSSTQRSSSCVLLSMAYGQSEGTRGGILHNALISSTESFRRLLLGPVACLEFVHWLHDHCSEWRHFSPCAGQSRGQSCRLDFRRCRQVASNVCCATTE